MILPGSEEYGPMPIAEFLSDTHTVPQITYFLSTFNHAIKQYTSRKAVIKKIETYFSLALIITAIKSFNDMTLARYLNLAYSFVTKKNIKFPEITIIHICSSHMIKTVLRKCKKIFNGNRQCKLAAHMITKLIHTDNMDAVNKTMRMVVVIFGLPHEVSMLNTYVQDLELERQENFENAKAQKDSDDESDEDDVEDVRCDINVKNDVETMHEDLSGRKASPFYSLFHDIYESILEEFSEEAKNIAQDDMPKKTLTSLNRLYTTS